MNTNEMNTDELFKALPMMVNINGNFYCFYLIKGQKRISVGYKTNSDKGGKHLCDTRRSGKTLKEALKSMLDWLIEFNYYGKESDNILVDMIHDSLNSKD